MAQKPVLISVQGADVASGNARSEDPVVSANGRFVAFESFAFNLAPVGPNGRGNIFYRDLQTGITTLVSVNVSGTGGGNGDSANPAISADGRYVAFESRATNLLAVDTNNNLDVFVRDMQTGITTLVSINSAGTGSGNQDSFNPTISANGRVVAFQSFASNLSAIDTNNQPDVFARDLQTGTMHLVSCNLGCTASGNNASFVTNVPKDKAPRANISNDGRVIVFESRATNLVTIPMAPNGFTEAFARDLQTGTTTLLSVNMQGTMSVGGQVPVISGDGRFAVFQSPAPDITANDSGGGLDLFRRDLQTGTTAMVSVTVTNTGSLGPLNNGYFPVISTDGRYITFQSNAKGYVANDLNDRYDAFRRDMQTNTTVLISGTTGGGTGAQNDALGAVMSSDGRYVAFIGFGDNFVSTTDTNHVSDVYLRDVDAGTTTLLSSNLAGTAASSFGGEYPVISADGRFTFFESSSVDSVPNTVSGTTNIFGVAYQGRAQFDLSGLTVNETDATATLNVTRTGDTSGSLTVQYATSNGNAAPGVDYTTAAGSITFAAGETAKAILINLNDDTLDEFNETVLLTVSDFNAVGASAGSLSASILTITDDDAPPSISVSDATVVEGNSGSAIRSFTLTLSAVSGKPITVLVASIPVTATQSSDYSFFTTLANISPGATSQAITFQVTGDTLYEDDETFTISLSSPTNVTIDKGAATITIQNDYPIPQITVFNVTLAETNSGTRAFNFFLNFSNPSSKQISIQYSTADGSAQAGSDYVGASGTFTILAGATFSFFTVVVNGDSLVENDETFFLNLTNPVGAALVNSQAVGTIQNDDLPILLLEENSQRAAALEVTTLFRDPFPLVRPFNFGPDLHTRISLFALNLALLPGENSSAVTVSAEDDFGFVHSLQVESVNVVPTDPTLSQIIVRLPDSVGNSTELKLKVTLRGQTSNVGVIRIALP
jgi:hypothetical protein